jgi:hypothetical protein
VALEVGGSSPLGHPTGAVARSPEKAPPGPCGARLVACPEQKSRSHRRAPLAQRQSNGLLIRRFRVRIPGGAPDEMGLNPFGRPAVLGPGAWSAMKRALATPPWCIAWATRSRRPSPPRTAGTPTANCSTTTSRHHHVPPRPAGHGGRRPGRLRTQWSRRHAEDSLGTALLTRPAAVLTNGSEAPLRPVRPQHRSRTRRPQRRQFDCTTFPEVVAQLRECECFPADTPLPCCPRGC